MKSTTIRPIYCIGLMTLMSCSLIQGEDFVDTQGEENPTASQGPTNSASVPTPTNALSTTNPSGTGQITLTTPTESPEPTESPIPVFDYIGDEWQAMTTLLIAEEDEGLDYDQNGTLDNGIYHATEVIAEILIHGTNEAIYYWVIGGPCADAGQQCVLTQSQADALASANEQLVYSVVTVNAINASLDLIYGQTANAYGLHIQSDVDFDNLTFHLGRSYAGLFEPQEYVGQQLGVVKHTNPSKFGPGDFSIYTEIPVPGLEDVPLRLDMTAARTSFFYNAQGLNAALTGGGVNPDQLSDFARQLLDLIQDSFAVPGLDADQIISDLDEALAQVADMTCPDQEDKCVSITFIFDTEPVELNEDERDSNKRQNSGQNQNTVPAATTGD